MSCDCTTITEIPDLIDVVCPEGNGQIGKLAFQFINEAFADITDESEWLTKIAANDRTKIQVTPPLDNGLMPTVDPVTKGGGDNTTFRGAVRFVADSPQTFTAELPDCPTDVIKKLRELICIKGMGIYLLKDGGVYSREDMSAMPIESFYTSSRGFNGFGENDTNTITFSIKGNWQDEALWSSTTWTPTELINTTI